MPGIGGGDLSEIARRRFHRKLYCELLSGTFHCLRNGTTSGAVEDPRHVTDEENPRLTLAKPEAKEKPVNTSVLAEAIRMIKE
jgi:hypothetical protein